MDDWILLLSSQDRLLTSEIHVLSGYKQEISRRRRK